MLSPSEYQCLRIVSALAGLVMCAFDLVLNPIYNPLIRLLEVIALIFCLVWFGIEGAILLGDGMVDEEHRVIKRRRAV